MRLHGAFEKISEIHKTFDFLCVSYYNKYKLFKFSTRLTTEYTEAVLSTASIFLSLFA